MTRFPFARHAQQLPPQYRDKFAAFARGAPADTLFRLVRDKAARRAKEPSVFAQKSEVA